MSMGYPDMYGDLFGGSYGMLPDMSSYESMQRIAQEIAMRQMLQNTGQYKPVTSASGKLPQRGASSRSPYDVQPFQSSTLESLGFNAVSNIAAGLMDANIIGIGQRNYSSLVQQRQQMVGQMELQQRMASQDYDAFMETSRGAFQMMGLEWDEQAKRRQAAVFNTVRPYLPYVAGMAPEMVSSLGGKYGSATVMAQKMMSTTRYRFNRDGSMTTFDDQGNYIENLHKTLYSPENVRNRLLRADQMGDLESEMRIRGYFAETQVQPEEIREGKNRQAMSAVVGEYLRPKEEDIDFSNDRVRTQFMRSYNAKMKTRRGETLTDAEKLDMSVADQFGMLRGLESTEDMDIVRQANSLAGTLQSVTYHKGQWRGYGEQGRQLEQNQRREMIDQQRKLKFLQQTTGLDEATKDVLTRVTGNKEVMDLVLEAEKLAGGEDGLEKNKVRLDEISKQLQQKLSKEDYDQLLADPKLLSRTGTLTEAQTVAKKLISYEGATKSAMELMAEAGHSNISASQAFQAMETMYGGNIRGLDPKRLERDLREIKEIARITGRGFEEIIDEVTALTTNLKAKGLNPMLGSQIAQRSAAMQMGFTQSNLIQTPYTMSTTDLSERYQEQVMRGIDSAWMNNMGAAKTIYDEAMASPEMRSQMKGSDIEGLLNAAQAGQETYRTKSGEIVSIPNISNEQVRALFQEAGVDNLRVMTSLQNEGRNKSVGAKAFSKSVVRQQASEMLNELDWEVGTLLNTSIQETTGGKMPSEQVDAVRRKSLRGVLEAKTPEEEAQAIKNAFSEQGYIGLTDDQARMFASSIRDATTGKLFQSTGMTIDDLKNMLSPEVSEKADAFQRQAQISAVISESTAGTTSQSMAEAMSKYLQSDVKNKNFGDFFKAVIGAEDRSRMGKKYYDQLLSDTKKYEGSLKAVDKARNSGADMETITNLEEESKKAEEALKKSSATIQYYATFKDKSGSKYLSDTKVADYLQTEEGRQLNTEIARRVYEQMEQEDPNSVRGYTANERDWRARSHIFNSERGRQLQSEMLKSSLHNRDDLKDELTEDEILERIRQLESGKSIDYEKLGVEKNPFLDEGEKFKPKKSVTGSDLVEVTDQARREAEGAQAQGGGTQVTSMDVGQMTIEIDQLNINGQNMGRAVTSATPSMVSLGDVNSVAG